MSKQTIQNGNTNTRPLPAGWRWARLGEVCAQDRQIIEPGTHHAAGRPYLSLEHIESNTGRILRHPSQALEDEGQSTTFAFDSRHVLYGKLRPYLNKVALPDFAGRCTTELIPLLPSVEMSREFLVWILRRQETVDMAMRGRTGSRMPRADMGDLLSLEIPLPPLATQREIARRLNRDMAEVARLRAAADRQRAAAAALPSAYLREVFESAEARGWPVVRLDDICRISTGTTPATDQPVYYAGDIPFVKTAEIVNNRINRAETHISPQAIADYSMKIHPPGTVLLAMYGQGKTRGQVGILEIAAATTQNAAAILPGNRLASDYLWLWLRGRYDHLREGGFQGDLAHLSLGYVKQLEIPLPSFNTQQVAVQQLEHAMAEVTHLRNEAERQRQAIDAMQAALLREVFGGFAG